MTRSRATSRLAARAFGAASVIAAIAAIELLIRAGVINRFVVPLPTEILVALPRIVSTSFWTGGGL